ncbi:MAG: thiamine pyrophosphate-dependent enzyme [Candidatus Magasanikbacteria bacterium]
MSHFSKFCPGCGQPVILQTLYRILQELKLEEKAVLGLDIGCALLAWDFLAINTFQTHHGRVTPTMVGFKRANPNALTFAYTGDGGAYAIGLQSILHAALRNDPVTVIVSNNIVYGMTGGQTSPTTVKGQKTDTSPLGNEQEPFFGPELLRTINKKVYIARTAMNDIKQLKEYLTKAIEAQQQGNFSLVEVLSFCPTNWKTKGIETNKFLEERLKPVFVTGEIL